MKMTVRTLSDWPERVTVSHQLLDVFKVLIFNLNFNRDDSLSRRYKRTACMEFFFPVG